MRTYINFLCETYLKSFLYVSLIMLSLIFILNLLSDESIAEIINKFGKALKELGGNFDDNLVSLEMNKMSEQIAAE